MSFFRASMFGVSVLYKNLGVTFWWDRNISFCSFRFLGFRYDKSFILLSISQIFSSMFFITFSSKL